MFLVMNSVSDSLYKSSLCSTLLDEFPGPPVRGSSINSGTGVTGNSPPVYGSSITSTIGLGLVIGSMTGYGSMTGMISGSIITS